MIQKKEKYGSTVSCLENAGNVHNTTLSGNMEILLQNPTYFRDQETFGHISTGSGGSIVIVDLW
jgi:hypothetical protein